MLDQFSESFKGLVNKMQGWIDAIILALPNLVLASFGIGYLPFCCKELEKSSRERTTTNEC